MQVLDYLELILLILAGVLIDLYTTFIWWLYFWALAVQNP